MKTVAIALALIYLALVAAMYLAQRKLQYHPENKGLTPELAGLKDVEVLRLKSGDGENIVAWYGAPLGENPVILFFQGNGGEIGDRPKRFTAYREAGFGVLYVSYRGYGGSGGSPTEQGLILDANAGYEWLMAQGVEPRRIAVVGESLGTGVAVQLAAEKPVAAVALEAPYTSTADIAARTYWWLPVRLLMKDQYRSVDYIGKVSAPLLVSHGDVDTLIPIEYGRRLFDAAREPKEFRVLPGEGHDALFTEAMWAGEIAFFRKHLK